MINRVDWRLFSFSLPVCITSIQLHYMKDLCEENILRRGFIGFFPVFVTVRQGTKEF
jgi:hypothetical protein